jgi:hypothetical protein
MAALGKAWWTRAVDRAHQAPGDRAGEVLAADHDHDTALEDEPGHARQAREVVESLGADVVGDEAGGDAGHAHRGSDARQFTCIDDRDLTVVADPRAALVHRLLPGVGEHRLAVVAIPDWATEVEDELVNGGGYVRTGRPDVQADDAGRHELWTTVMRAPCSLPRASSACW